MKNLIFLALLFQVINLAGQDNITVLDSVAIEKPKMHEEYYKFFDFGPKEIQYREIETILTASQESGLDVGGAVLTLFTGIGTTSMKEGSWRLSGNINCNDTLADWTVNINCEGYRRKEREGERNDDGSRSMETDRINSIYWERPASVVIIEGTDTIGFFSFIINIPADELQGEWHDNIFNNRSLFHSGNVKNFNIVADNNAFGRTYEIKGIFRGNNFAIVENGRSRKVWIFTNGLLACMFQGDIDYKGVKKKNRNIPYFMINREIPGSGRRDLFRLAIMIRFMNKYLDSDRI